MFNNHLIIEALVRQHQDDLVHDQRLSGNEWRDDANRSRRRFGLRS